MRHLVWLFSAAGLATAGCAYRGSATSFEPHALGKSDGWVAVLGVPYADRQPDIDDGGAGALAAVLRYWHESVTTADVKAACPSHTDSGETRADDLRSFALDKGFAAFLLQGELDIIRHELTEQRPVVVGLIKRYGVAMLQARYEVVVGYNPERDLIVTLDPARGWQQNTLEGFLSEWEPSERLLLVVIPQGEGESSDSR